MRLAFFRSKVSKEEREQEAAREFEAAIARAAPPSDAERTWSRPESEGEWRARAESLGVTHEPAQAAEADVEEPAEDEQSEPDLYSIGVVDEPERELYEQGVVAEAEPVGAQEPAAAKPRSTRPRAGAGTHTSSSTRRPAGTTRRAPSAAPGAKNGSASRSRQPASGRSRRS